MSSRKAQQQVHEPSHEVLQQLNSLERSSPDFPDQLISLLSRQDYKDLATADGAQSEDRVWFIEYLDNVCMRFTVSTLYLACIGSRYP